MLETIHDIVTLFAGSFYGSLIVGVVCPLLGVFFLLRRMAFLGIAVPQFAAAGVAFGFLVLPFWNRLTGSEAVGHAAHEGSFGFYLAFALIFSFGALLVLVWLGRRGEGSPEGRIAAGYAAAGAVTILFLSASAFGGVHIDNLLKGEILAISEGELLVIVLLFGLALLLFLLFQRDFLLVAWDREAAVSMGKNPLLWDLLLYLLVGAAISVGVLTVGPLVVFGLMVIPPMAARPLAFNMPSFYILAALIGLLTSLFGFLAAYLLDWPLGPTDVALAFLLMVLVHIARWGVRKLVPRTA